MGGDRSRFTACVNIWTLSKQLFLESQGHWRLWWGPISHNHTLPKDSILPYYVCNLKRCQIISGYNKHLVHFLTIPNLWLLLHMSYLCWLGSIRCKPTRNAIAVPNAQYELFYFITLKKGNQAGVTTTSQ